MAIAEIPDPSLPWGKRPFFQDQMFAAAKVMYELYCQERIQDSDIRYKMGPRSGCAFIGSSIAHKLFVALIERQRKNPSSKDLKELQGHMEEAVRNPEGNENVVVYPPGKRTIHKSSKKLEMDEFGHIFFNDERINYPGEPKYNYWQPSEDAYRMLPVMMGYVINTEKGDVLVVSKDSSTARHVARCPDLFQDKLDQLEKEGSVITGSMDFYSPIYQLYKMSDLSLEALRNNDGAKPNGIGISVEKMEGRSINEYRLLRTKDKSSDPMREMLFGRVSTDYDNQGQLRVYPIQQDCLVPDGENTYRIARKGELYIVNQLQDYKDELCTFPQDSIWEQGVLCDSEFRVLEENPTLKSIGKRAFPAASDLSALKL